MHRMSVAEFHAWQPPFDLADRRWSLVEGQPVCMAPASQTHGAILSETVCLIGNHFVAVRSNYRSGVTPSVIPRVRSEMNERVPDLGITCSPDRTSHSLPDPVLLIEILSPSNELNTRANVWAYASIPSVREILLLSSTAIAAELLRRDPAGEWPPSPEILSGAAHLRLESIGFGVRLAALYATSWLALPDNGGVTQPLNSSPAGLTRGSLSGGWGPAGQARG